MVIEKEKQGEKLVLKIEGRLDTLTAPQLSEVIGNELDGVRELIFDFSKLEYLSSAGLRVLLSAQKRMNRQGYMEVRHVGPLVQEVFELTGFNQILTIR